MRKLWLLAAVLALVLAVGLAGCSQGGTLGGVPEVRVNLNSQQEGIWVNGQGKVSAVPDVAALSLGIESQEAGVSEAQSKAAAAMNKVIDSLKGNGVAEKDIQTQYFNIQRVTRWDNDKQQEVVLGYRVTNTVSAKIRQLDKTGAIIDAVALAGGDLTRVNGISFSVDDPKPYYQTARQQAMADAKAKAEQIANLAGVRLGKPTYITESGQAPPPIFRQAIMEAVPAPMPAETPISPGELEINLSVQVTYAILN